MLHRFDCGCAWDLDAEWQTVWCPTHLEDAAREEQAYAAAAAFDRGETGVTGEMEG